MIGRIKLNIPFLFSFAGLIWFKNRQAGFSFCNRTTLILAENIGKSIDEIPKWVDENRALYYGEMLYAAHLAYCQENYIKPTWTRKKLIEGYMKLPEEEQKKIVKAWNDSVNIGAKPLPGKKKQGTNRMTKR